jgi:hypothetical protein
VLAQRANAGNGHLRANSCSRVAQLHSRKISCA